MTMGDSIFDLLRSSNACVGDNHRFGCHCDKECVVTRPCPTASVEWNSVRAQWALARASEPRCMCCTGAVRAAHERGPGPDHDVRCPAYRQDSGPGAYWMVKR